MSDIKSCRETEGPFHPTYGAYVLYEAKPEQKEIVQMVSRLATQVLTAWNADPTPVQNKIRISVILHSPEENATWATVDPLAPRNEEEVRKRIKEAKWSLGVKIHETRE